MFSEMLASVKRNEIPETITLQKRFDFALTKKLGILKLPSAFWMSDPKINPRADHLFWAALLLRDPERIEMALAVITAEQEEYRNNRKKGGPLETEEYVQMKVEELILLFSNLEIRNRLLEELSEVVPETLKPKFMEMS